VDLAPLVDDLVWEQILESALRKRLVAIAALEAELPGLARSRHKGLNCMRRVLDQRPAGAPPTESLLETLFVQLARLVAGIGTPTRQLRIYNRHGDFVARVDLCWPELGLFIELDGQQHKGQPVYDAIRQTAVTGATGWLCGRFTWTEVVRFRAMSARRLAELVEQARRRPVVG
jgi:very-short-patch-repair endonuclease